MQYRVLFNAFSVRTTPIHSSYRPDWFCNNKPEYNCAQLIFNDIEMISPGEMHICLLTPMCPELWGNVVVNDVLKCMEGSRQVGEATVLEII